MTLSGVCASASASVIPAGPPPMIATSGCRIVPDGMARASRNAFKAGLSVDYWCYGTRTVGSCLVAFVAERNMAVDRNSQCGNCGRCAHDLFNLLLVLNITATIAFSRKRNRNSQCAHFLHLYWR